MLVMRRHGTGWMHPVQEYENDTMTTWPMDAGSWIDAQRSIRRAPRPRALILAPSNLGLRPPKAGREPGSWRAPDALVNAGLLQAIHPAEVYKLPRPAYSPVADALSGILNGPAIRSFDLKLADAIFRCSAHGTTPVVIGGNCSILPGALAGVRRLSPLMLLHFDGHSDFRHPGNYDRRKTPGTVAGMDLALATGRGVELLTHWPGLPVPLVTDEDVVQIGERESRDADWVWPDIRNTAIRQIDIFQMRKHGREWVQRQIDTTLSRNPDWPFWIHLDVDVLDERVMPAVDSPGRPGMKTSDVSWFLRNLSNRPSIAGISVTVFDPDLDPEGTYARRIVSMLGDGFAAGVVR